MYVYRIILDGHLSEQLVRWLECVSADNRPSGEAVLVSQALDRAGLHGLLARLRDIDISIISITRVDERGGQS